MISSNTPLKLALGLCLIGALGMGSVEAHKGATGIVKQRMTAMKNMGSIMKDWAAVRKGRAAFDGDRVRDQAAAMKEHAVEMAALFPPDSNTGVSEAMPAIWKNWPAFTEIAKKLEILSTELGGKASAGKSSSLPLMIQIGGTCSACHKDFRKEKD